MPCQIVMQIAFLSRIFVFVFFLQLSPRTCAKYLDVSFYFGTGALEVRWAQSPDPELLHTARLVFSGQLRSAPTSSGQASLRCRREIPPPTSPTTTRQYIKVSCSGQAYKYVCILGGRRHCLGPLGHSEPLGNAGQGDLAERELIGTFSGPWPGRRNAIGI